MANIPPDDLNGIGSPNDENLAAQSQNFEGEASLENDLKQLQSERDALFDRLARVQADFKNAQKRLQADKEQAVQYANAQIIQSMLPVIDNFERALAVDPAKTDAAAILQGMKIVQDQWLKMLQAQQVRQIAPEPGEEFDPARHSALMQQDDPRFADSPQPVVTQLMQKGYELHGRVLRPAQVAVSKTS